MTVQTDRPEVTLKLEDSLIDSSINDARWLLGSVAALGFFVVGIGLFASTLAA